MTPLILGFGMPNTTEWLIILAIFLLVFGAAKLPKLMRSLGSSAHEFKKGMDEGAPKKDATASESKVEDDAKPEV